MKDIPVRIVPKTKRANGYAQATCPYCLVSYPVDIYGNADAARVTAVDRIRVHIKAMHPEKVTEDSGQGTPEKA